MSLDEELNVPNERKIRFRPPSHIHFNSDHKTDELPQHGEDEVDHRKKVFCPSFLSFLQMEVTRDYALEHDEERFSARRQKIYTFVKIPREMERFMSYGFMQCTDSFLFVYTFLPIRVILALYALITRPIYKCFGLLKRNNNRILTPAEICDLLKAVLLLFGSMVMSTIDTSMWYHLIKSQSVIKLYIFFNMLEVGDKLLSAFGQDAIDALFWTATEPKGRKREHFGLIPHLLFAMAYVLLHSMLLLFQATTLNVAINSNNKALLTIMMSNNFVEIKGSVFKKFDKNNLFQVSCSDVRERFHLFVLLFIVVLQTMREYSWKGDRLLMLIFDSVLVLLIEVLVDWVKHAFITRFNELNFDVYKDYTISLAYDMAQTRQKNAFSDHCDLVARRMGFIPIPLGVLLIRVLINAIHLDNLPSIIVFIIGYLCLVSFKILNSILIMGRACNLIAQHKQEKATTQSPSTRSGSPLTTSIILSSSSKTSVTTSSSTINKDSATSPFHPILQTTIKQNSNNSNTLTEQNGPLLTDLGAAAIFANSTVDLQNVTLNDELLKVEDDEIKIETIDNVTRSFPNINYDDGGGSDEVITTPIENLKRAESEPSLLICNDDDDVVSQK